MDELVFLYSSYNQTYRYSRIWERSWEERRWEVPEKSNESRVPQPQARPQAHQPQPQARQPQPVVIKTGRSFLDIKASIIVRTGIKELLIEN